MTHTLVTVGSACALGQLTDLNVRLVCTVKPSPVHVQADCGMRSARGYWDGPVASSPCPRASGCAKPCAQQVEMSWPKWTRSRPARDVPIPDQATLHVTIMEKICGATTKLQTLWSLPAWRAAALVAVTMGGAGGVVVRRRLQWSGGRG